jgi:hypothetical protein
LDEKKETKEELNRKPVESRLDQENIILLPNESETSSKYDSNKESGVCVTVKEKVNSKVGAGSRKRKKDGSDEPKVAKKARKASAAPKSKKSKVPEISNGQKRLTDFFRL